MAAHLYWRILALSNNTGAFSEIGFSEIEMATSAGGANAATGGTASASAFFNNNSTYNADKAFDGNTGTDWVSGFQVPSGWIQYQFASATDVREIRLRCRNSLPNQTVRDFLVLASDDGTFAPSTTYIYLMKNDVTWTSGVTQTFSIPATAIPVATAQPTKTRWRILIAQSDGGPDVGAREIEFAASVGGANIATGGTAAAAESTGGFGPERAFDGTTNEWVGDQQVNAGWIQYTLATAAAVASCRYTTRGSTAANQGPRAFWVLAGSTDSAYETGSEDWQIVAAVDNSTGWTSAETRTFSWALSTGVDAALDATTEDCELVAEASMPLVALLDATTEDCVLISAATQVGDGTLALLDAVTEDCELDAAATVDLVVTLDALTEDCVLYAVTVSGTLGPFPRRPHLVLN